MKGGASFPILLLFVLRAVDARSQSAGAVFSAEDAAALRHHVSDVPLQVSADGQWIAHTWYGGDVVQEIAPFSGSGVPATQGPFRLNARLTEIKTGAAVDLGGIGRSSWAPVWSPDGRRVAFYSDEGGTAGLWIWNKQQRRADRFPDVIARPYFTFQTPHWFADGERLLVKILPEGLSVPQANALIPAFDSKARHFQPVRADAASVLVWRTEQAPSSAADFSNTEFADLAILDIGRRSVTRVAERVRAAWYAISPDQREIAWSVRKPAKPNEQFSRFDLMVRDIGGGPARRLATDLDFEYGINIGWSPDGRHLAYLTSAGGCFAVSLADGKVRQLGDADTPGFYDSFAVPAWDEAGRIIYVISQRDSALWRLEVASGAASRVAAVPRRRIVELATHFGSRIVWTPAAAHAAWVRTWNPETQQSGIAAIDLNTGASRMAVEEAKVYDSSFGAGASGNTLAFVSSDQRQEGEFQAFDTARRGMRRVSQLNPVLGQRELGAARLIEWNTADGTKLRGTLLLPPQYRAERRYPLVVFVYGGALGSEALNSFGLWGGTAAFNFQILAARGYAVLFPDTPLTGGKPMEELMAAVMPAVRRTVDMGVADEQRLAVMGQSFGSYCALALITQTTMFRAALISGVLDPDLLGGYLSMNADGSDNVDFFEQGQPRLGGTPWQYRDRYLDNAPFWRFDRIETPVLIVNGNDDPATPSRGADSVFVALRRLGKKAEYRLYEREGHVIVRTPNVLDLWRRRLEFLAEHLDLSTDDRRRVIFDGGRAKSSRPP